MALYHLMCTDVNGILVNEICLTLCSFWSESNTLASTSFTHNDLAAAYNRFYRQIKSDESDCLALGNLRSWLNFVAHLLSLQHQYLTLTSQVTSSCSVAQTIPIEELDWFFGSILDLMSLIKLADIFDTIETSSKPFEVILLLSILNRCSLIRFSNQHFIALVLLSSFSYKLKR